jgi:hypothetical protein
MDLLKETPNLSGYEMVIEKYGQIMERYGVVGNTVFLVAMCMQKVNIYIDIASDEHVNSCTSDILYLKLINKLLNRCKNIDVPQYELSLDVLMLKRVIKLHSNVEFGEYTSSDYDGLLKRFMIGAQEEDDNGQEDDDEQEEEEEDEDEDEQKDDSLSKGSISDEEYSVNIDQSDEDYFTDSDPESVSDIEPETIELVINDMINNDEEEDSDDNLWATPYDSEDEFNKTYFANKVYIDTSTPVIYNHTGIFRTVHKYVKMLDHERKKKFYTIATYRGNCATAPDDLQFYDGFNSSLFDKLVRKIHNTYTEYVYKTVKEVNNAYETMINEEQVDTPTTIII